MVLFSRQKCMTMKIKLQKACTDYFCANPTKWSNTLKQFVRSLPLKMPIKSCCCNFMQYNLLLKFCVLPPFSSIGAITLTVDRNGDHDYFTMGDTVLVHRDYVIFY